MNARELTQTLFAMVEGKIPTFLWGAPGIGKSSIVKQVAQAKNIGFIELGQKAKVKVTAFDFSTYGGLEGEVVFISADTITDKKGNSYYLARIRTNSNIIVDKKGKEHTIIPGMKTEVDIILDKKNILSYILKPMLK
jgi:adhesin transport system membrane fusion protein